MGRTTQPAQRARIAGLGAYIPDKVLSNADLERMVDTSDDWITERTGIKERRIAADDQAASHLATGAALQAMERAGVEPDEVDLVLVATATPDMLFPSTASLIQDRLGCAHAAAFDLSAGCTGFVYGLVVASQFIESGSYETIVVVGAEKLSAITDWEDRSTCVLFGDGAGAAVLRPCKPDRGILAFELGSDGSGGDVLCIPAGGSLKPTSEETLRAREHFLRMAGREVFRFAARALVDSSERVMAKVGIGAEDVALLIPHQANRRITEAAAKRLGVPRERVFDNIDRFGNTSAASIPIALWEAQEQGLLHDGDFVVLTGFGAGLTWGACAIRWTG